MQPYAGSVSSSYVDLFGSIVSKYPFEDYVFLRNDSNQYTLYIGDLTLEGASFFGDAVCYQLTYDNTYQTSYYTLTQTDAACSVDVSNGIVYSNLGFYPTLTERGSVYDFATLLLLFVCCCYILISSIFNAIRR